MRRRAYDPTPVGVSPEVAGELAAFVLELAKLLVTPEWCEDLMVRVHHNTPGRGALKLELLAPEAAVGQLTGSGGRTAQAIRRVLTVRAGVLGAGAPVDLRVSCLTSAKMPE